jgi:solute carrier family 35 protein E1
MLNPSTPLHGATNNNNNSYFLFANPEALLGIIELILYGISWYVSSAVCNTSARRLLTISPHPLWLCVSQFAIAWIVLTTYFYVWKPEARIRPPIEARYELNRLSLAYTLGFVFVNAGYIAVNVSLAETLRSAEPLFSVLFSKLWLHDEYVSLRTTLTLIPIVFGGILSSGGDRSFNWFGLVFVCLSNTCFALRSVFTKQLKRVHPSGDAINVFYDITRIGLLWLIILALFWDGLMWVMVLDDCHHDQPPCDNTDSNPKHLNVPFLSSSGPFMQLMIHVNETTSYFIRIVFVNGLSYFLYNQMSFIVLSKVSVVSHAVGNSFRRVVTILASVWYFKNPINYQNALGITLAILGVVLYSISRSKDIEMKETTTLR